MLAGYLPFDDDPANPEGDNINLLYKYIVTTPLTFPEYVTPHARDLLRRILVPNPRKRADLFEVARHSWLSEYAHVVEFITSSTTLPSDVKDAPPPAILESMAEPGIGRSSSVREASKPKSPQVSTVGGLSKQQGIVGQDNEPRTPKDTKRRTVQLEYVPPTTQTQRGTDIPSVTRTQDTRDTQDKPLPQDPPNSRESQTRNTGSNRPPANTQQQQRYPAGPRVPQDGRGASENTFTARPRTGGSMQSSHSMGLQNYGQPAPPEIADTNAQGRIQQPDIEPVGRPSMGAGPKFSQLAGVQTQVQGNEGKGHKRSNTIGEISAKFLGRNGSVFGRSKKRIETMEKPSRKYPPVSLSQPIPTGEEATSRPSIDSRHSRRSFSLGLGKKRSGSISGSQGSGSGEKPDRRRFSLLPASFSLKAIGLGKESDSRSGSEFGSQPNLATQQRSVTAHGDARGSSPFFDNLPNRPANSGPAHHQRYASAQLDNRRPNAIPSYLQNSSSYNNNSSDPAVDQRRPPTEPQLGSYQHDMAQSEGWDGQRLGSSRGAPRTVLQKNQRKFTDAYEQDDYRGHEGSSGAAKRVMDFFRRRGKARGGDDR